MPEPQVAPYGSWKSPITSELIAASTIGLGQPAVDGEAVYWTELRPAEGGRSVVVRCAATGQVEDLTPPPYHVRTRAHEYGGGAYVVADGVVYFSNFADQRLYRHEPGAEPKPLTPAAEMRYADAVVDRWRGRLICVREDHTGGGEPVNSVVAVPLEGGGPGRILAEGHDFFAAPRLSPDGSRLAWLAWDHPNMPWDGTELWLAELAADGSVARRERVAGGPEESIFQPEWSPDGELYFVSDRTGWWNLYRLRGGRVEALHPREAEFGRPQWVFGLATYDFESPERLICAYSQRGTWRLAWLDSVTGELRELETAYTSIRDLRAAPGRAVFLAGSPTEPESVVRLDLASGATIVLRRSTTVAIEPGYLSLPEPIEFPTEQGQTAYGFFYRPRNRDFVAPPGERPPLLVMSHGGPTSATSAALNLAIQYWTSRGIAVLDVNYGGSTGYGRRYRERLNGQWGVVDVDDSANAARYLVRRSEVDGARLAIRGGSAGGYTTLCALTFRDTFGAGASYYGVSDLEALARETHKFESRYLDRLVGPYPQRSDLYRERSPIHFAERLSCPVIFFQGLEDRVVPPDQAERMVQALRARGLPVAYLAFEGEQHGFRRAETIQRSLDAELYFYSQVFGFALADPVEPVEIENLPRR